MEVSYVNWLKLEVFDIFMVLMYEKMLEFLGSEIILGQVSGIWSCWQVYFQNNLVIGSSLC